jgi:predicted TIM-barrel fold metal-dependent hydrolase
MARIILPEVLVRIKDPGVSFDIHCHMFNYRCVPNGFLGVRLPFTRRFMGNLEEVLKFIGTLGKSEEITNASYFIDMFGKSCLDIRNKLFEYYPASTVFCPLLMDMDDSIKGREKDNYADQITEVQRLCEDKPGRMLPFLCLNPLNPKMSDIYAQYFGTQTEFWGVKIYPSLGYLPSHPKLIEIFKDCAAKKIPVTVHCSAATVHYNLTHHIRNIKSTKLVNGKQVVVTESGWYWSRDDFSRFNDPKNWVPVLQQVPDLILNFAHFGGYEQWEDYVKGKSDTWTGRILSLMQAYPGVYTDFAYTWFQRALHKPLRELIESNELVRNRVLYGSDFYMVTMEGHFREIKTLFDLDMGDAILKQIAFKNPRQFLFPEWENA